MPSAIKPRCADANQNKAFAMCTSRSSTTLRFALLPRWRSIAIGANATCPLSRGLPPDRHRYRQSNAGEQVYSGAGGVGRGLRARKGRISFIGKSGAKSHNFAARQNGHRRGSIRKPARLPWISLPHASDGIEDFAAAKSRSVLEGGRFPVASLKDIIASKRAAGREKDLHDVKRLKRLRTNTCGASDDCSRSPAIDHRLFQETRDREPAAERRASARAFVRQKRIELYLEFERAALRTGARAPARTRPAPRPGRTAPTSARHGGIRRPRFRCDKRALIPRPETEQLVE